MGGPNSDQEDTAREVQAKSTTSTRSAEGSPKPQARINYGQVGLPAELRWVITSLDAATASLNPAQFSNEAMTNSLVLAANKHLAHAITLRASAPIDDVELVYAHDRLSTAIATALDVIPRRFKNERLTADVDALFEIEQTARVQARLPSAYQRRTLSGPVDQVGVLVAAFRAATAETRKTLDELEASTEDTRDAIVVRRVPILNERIAYADANLGAIKSPQVKEAADVLGTTFLAVHTWVRSRTNNRGMLAHVEAVESRLDVVLDGVGLPKVLDRPPQTLRTAREANEAKDETDNLESLIRQANSAMDHFEKMRGFGIDRFAGLATLKEVIEPSAWQEIAKAILTATIGHIGGAFVGIVASGANALARKLEEISIDAIQGVAGKLDGGILTGATAAAQKEANFSDRARIYFVEGLKAEAAESTKLYKDGMEKALRAGELSSRTVAMEIEDLKRLGDRVRDLYAQKASHGWASCIAQLALGRDANSPRDNVGRQTSKTAHYYGRGATNFQPAGIRGRVGTTGTLAITCRIQDPDPRDPSITPILQSSYTFNGLNPDVAAEIIKDVDGSLERLWVIKEITLHMREMHWSCVVNERGEVGDVLDWQALTPKYYRSPEAFYKHLRSIPIQKLV